MADVAEDHTFTVRNLAPERYTVRLAGRVSPELYIKSIRAGDIDVLHEGLAVSQTGTISLEIVLASDGGQLEGTVLDKSEQAVAGATVALVPDPGRRGTWLQPCPSMLYGQGWSHVPLNRNLLCVPNASGPQQMGPSATPERLE